MLFSRLLCATLAYAQYSRADNLPADVSRGGNSSSLSIKLSNGDNRNYLLHIPRNYNESSPVGLLWVYAGRGGDNGHAESFTQFSDPKSNPDMMVVYPQGTADRTGEDVWQGDPNAKTDDINFTLELLNDLQKTYAIDEGRIYAAGQSNGGGFVANHLACDVDASQRFAAFGAVSAAYYQLNRRSCNADKVKIKCNNNGTKIALIDVHGGQDRTIEYAGGHRRRACLPSIPHFVTSWAERNGMNTSNRTSEVHNGNAMHYSFGEGATDGMVQSYYVPTMGHVWASGSNGEVLRATDVLLDFFSRWTMEKRNEAAATLPDTSGSTILRPIGFVALFVPAAMAVIQLV
jgi:poly(3-hydroxybutyrate) depolymerase